MTNESLFSERLKEARKSRGWSQAEAADVAGVSREYWGRCERGASMPGGEVLAALAAADFDVMYVLTGQPHGTAAPALTAEEQTLLDYFREGSKEVRRAALGALLGATAMPQGAGLGTVIKSPGAGMVNNSPGGVMVGKAGGKVTVKKGR